MAHLNFLVLFLRPFFPRGTRVLVRQNSTVSAALAFGDLPGYTRPLYRLLYHRADRIVCQTNAMAYDLAPELGLPVDLLAVLPNPVDVEAIRAATKVSSNNWSGPGPHLLAIGRLAPVKGFDLLLPALQSVRVRYPNADLLIAGAGPEEAALKSLALSLGLIDSVRFAGHLARPWDYFRDATLFVLSSRHEGLPNALLEAAAAGLPLVTSPASEGLVDLLHEQPGVWIAPETTSAALAGSLLAALDVLQPRQRFPHPFVQQFGIERAIQAYEDLIDATLRGPQR
jgi:glycosyltransferase involved in cell wall biosynthesis